MDATENTSGHGSVAVVPPEIDRWNWGAFTLNWIWGIGNDTWIALLMFVPIINFAMPFVLGAKGSAWAWRNRRWESAEHFHRVQRKWAWWGLAAWIAFIALVVGIVFAVMLALKNSDIYKQAVRHVESSEEAMEVLGPPISAGFPSGSFEVSGGKGKADFSFDVQGSKARGTVYLDASMSAGKWEFRQLELAVQGREKRIDLDP